MYEDKTQNTLYRISEKGVEPVEGWVIGESQWAMYVNGIQTVTFMATPTRLHHLALGFLVSENLISGLGDIHSIRVNEAADRAYWFIPALGLNETRAMAVCEEGVGSIHVQLNRTEFKLPSHPILTSGCGGGITFDDMTKNYAPLNSRVTIHAKQITALMHDLNQRAELYRTCRGVHTSGLSDGKQLLVIAEDVGRHNTLDKIRGECLLREISTHDKILLTTGRISSEMMTKAAKMQAPIVVSRTSPTQLSLNLARAWNITLVGYAHAGQMQVYNGIERIRTDDGEIK
jgi:FdhD protein